MMTLQYFRAEDRYDPSQRSRSNPRDHSGDQDKVGRLRGRLQGTSDTSKDGADEDTIDSTDPIRQPTSGKTSKDGSQVVDGNDTTLMEFIGDDAVGTDTNRVDIVGRGVDASHDTLIIAFEENGDQGEDLNSDGEVARAKALPKLGARRGEHLDRRC